MLNRYRGREEVPEKRLWVIFRNPYHYRILLSYTITGIKVLPCLFRNDGNVLVDKGLGLCHWNCNFTYSSIWY